MKKKNLPNRCGQCGRTFTKAQWRRNDFFCSQCRKFECYDCVGSARICRACGTKVSRIIHKISNVGIVMGLICFPIFLLSVFIKPPENQNEWFAVGLMVSLPLIIFMIGLTFFFIERKQKKQHLEYLSTMPAGIIPIESQIGFNDPDVKRRWREENLKRTTRNAPANKGTFPVGAFDGLVGEWDYPIMSKEQRIKHERQSGRRMSYVLLAMMSFGVFCLIFSFLVVMEPLCITTGFILTLFGLFFIWVSYHNIKYVKREPKAETSATWKKVGFETTILAIEEFLRNKRLTYMKKIDDWPLNSLYNNPEYKYVLNNDIYISSLYSENSDGRVYRWLNFGYNTQNYILAKKILRDLDEFLTERDLIRRVV